jgi:hypothetical protein
VILRIFLAIAAFFPLAAQDPPANLLWISREQIKPGKVAPYMRIEEGAARTCARLNCPNPYFAITSLTGPSEAWWINGFDSMDALEHVRHEYEVNQEIGQALNSVAESKADLAFDGVDLLAVFHPEMSFYSTPIFPRYISITVLQLRPGHLQTLRTERIPFKAALERAGRPQWVYQVTSGTDDDTFLIMTPARTVQELQSIPTPIDHNDAVGELIVSSRTRLYAVAPSLSMPAKSWIEADPEFWKRP